MMSLAMEDSLQLDLGLNEFKDNIADLGPVLRFIGDFNKTNLEEIKKNEGKNSFFNNKNLLN